jgi:hypothetical protein
VPEHSPAKPPGQQREELTPKGHFNSVMYLLVGRVPHPCPVEGIFGEPRASLPTPTFLKKVGAFGEDEPDMIQHRKPAQPSRYD